MTDYGEVLTLRRGATVSPIPNDEGEIISGCGIVLSLEPNRVKILTDFGNGVILSYTEFDDHYIVTGNQDVLERLNKQLENLKDMHIAISAGIL